MLLCYVKGSQLDSSGHTYKGRIVYCGNTIDQDGDQAVFSAQGTGSSHLSAAKFVAIARLPGYAGQDSDASGAYTQTTLKETKTFITSPKE